MTDERRVSPAPATGRSAPEAWLRGPLPGIDPYLMPAAHAFVQAAEDLQRLATGLTHAELWARPGGAASVGFHLRHIAGSSERLLAYARGAALTPEQLAAAASEKEPLGPELAAEELAARCAAALHAVVEALRAVPHASLLEARGVGRAQLPSNVLGLLFHAAEHAQRHVGQALATAKAVRGA